MMAVGGDDDAFAGRENSAVGEGVRKAVGEASSAEINIRTLLTNKIFSNDSYAKMTSDRFRVVGACQSL